MGGCVHVYLGVYLFVPLEDLMPSRIKLSPERTPPENSSGLRHPLIGPTSGVRDICVMKRRFLDQLLVIRAVDCSSQWSI